jgi:hypothetical protein
MKSQNKQTNDINLNIQSEQINETIQEDKNPKTSLANQIKQSNK